MNDKKKPPTFGVGGFLACYCLASNQDGSCTVSVPYRGASSRTHGRAPGELRKNALIWEHPTKAYGMRQEMSIDIGYCIYGCGLLSIFRGTPINGDGTEWDLFWYSHQFKWYKLMSVERKGLDVCGVGCVGFGRVFYKRRIRSHDRDHQERTQEPSSNGGVSD